MYFFLQNNQIILDVNLPKDFEKKKKRNEIKRARRARVWIAIFIKKIKKIKRRGGVFLIVMVVNIYTH